MEKRRPTYDLDAIKAAIGSVETLIMTRSALSDALSLGFNRAGIVAVIRQIRRPMRLYVKFQADVVTEFRVMSFKEI